VEVNITISNAVYVRKYCSFIPIVFSFFIDYDIVLFSIIYLCEIAALDLMVSHEKHYTYR